MLFWYVWLATCSCIDPNKFVVYVFRHWKAMDLHFLQHIVGSLYVSKLAAGFKHGHKGVPIWDYVMSMHLPPIVDGFLGVSFCAG
jgi:hypothetical protein